LIEAVQSGRQAAGERLLFSMRASHGRAEPHQTSRVVDSHEGSLSVPALMTASSGCSANSVTTGEPQQDRCNADNGCGRDESNLQGLSSTGS
jgi:hypothetical protein